MALNCVAVGKLLEKFNFDHIHVDPVPYDGGLVLGAAQYVYYHLLKNKRIEWKDNFTPYLGERYDITMLLIYWPIKILYLYSMKDLNLVEEH